MLGCLHFLGCVHFWGISISIGIGNGDSRRLLNTLEHFLTMLDNIIVNKTSPEANWNRRANRQADAKDHVLGQAGALTKKLLHKIYWKK